MNEHSGTPLPMMRVGSLRKVIFLALLVLMSFTFNSPEAMAADVIAPNFTPQYIGSSYSHTISIAAGDMDGNGTLDIVQGNQSRSLLFLNHGQNEYSTGIPVGWSNQTNFLQVGDVNNDGALDIVAPYGIYFNDGYGNFASPLVYSTRSNVVALGDVNGDGDLDIIQGNYNEKSYVFVNNGDGEFSTGTPFGDVSQTRSIVVADINNDGRLDIIQGNENQLSTVFLNNGMGGFSSGIPFGNAYMTTSVAVGDLNGDGALDIVQGNKCYEMICQKSLIHYNLGDGSGRFNSGVPFGGENDTRSISLGDINGDGAVDIVQGNYCSANNCQNNFFLNDGFGGFSTGVPFGEADTTTFVSLADMNSDGALDILQGSEIRLSALFINDGIGGFGKSAAFGGQYKVWDAAVGDVDGNGALDIVQGNNGQASIISLNDGQGTFSDPVPFGGEFDTYSVVLGDLNSDGALDIVQGNNTQQGMVYFNVNDGSGSFGSGLPFGGLYDNISLALGDLDGDGDLDIIQGNQSQHNVVYFNNGQGEFGAGIPFGEIYPTSSIAVGDINGDGSLDIIQGSHMGWNYVYLNNGKGFFGEGTEVGSYAAAIALGDLNGDGALDIVQGSLYRQCVVYINDRKGGFDSGTPFGPPRDTKDIGLGDMDGDGDLDIVQGNWDQQSIVYFNNGHGNFPSAGIPFGGTVSIEAIALGDVNGDGLLDIVQGDRDGNDSVVYLNTRFSYPNLPNNPPTVAVFRPGTTQNANFFSTSEILDNTPIPINFKLMDPEGDPVRFIRAFYSLNGGGDWHPAIAAPGTVPPNYNTLSLSSQIYSKREILPIPDLGTVNSSIVLSTEEIIVDLDVVLNIHHTYDEDLVVRLTAPNNRSITLVNHRGYSGDNFTNTILDDEADIPISDGSAPFTGRFRPEEPLYLFNKIPVTGTWYLSISDMARDDIGNLSSWSLIITTNLGRVYTYSWDVFQSGFFGFSDNVVLRIEAYTSLDSEPNSVPTFLYSSASATTFPFRVRGTQVRVEPNALMFNGANDYIDIPDSASLDLTDELTLEAWVNLGNPQLDQKIAGKTPIWSGYLLGVQYGNLYPEVWDSAGNRYTFYAGEIPPDTWTHVAVTWKSGGQMMGYVNGNQVMSIPASANPIGVNDNPLRIGKAPWGDAFTVAGMIDDVRIWRTARSQPEILRDMYRQLTGDEPYLIGYWPFEEHAGGIVYDQTTNDNDGLLGEGITAYQPDWISSFQAGSALVYRLTHLDGIAEPMGGYDFPFTANLYGYLSGRGILNKDDKIVALAPIYKNDTLTLYHTSASPNSSGLDLHTVQVGGVQSLEVSAENPLILFNLDISLEWDASQDTRFQEQLKYNLQRTSQLLFDWSNGQVALGNVRVFHNRQNWNEAHLRIYASNRLRPNADLGGVVLSAITETVLTPRGENFLLYQPGQVRIGPSWNRFGDEEGMLGEDWPRALAHELSHYLFFLDDNYLGLDDDNGLVFPIYSCPGAMTDPYRDDDSARFDEFHSKNEWDMECAQTLSNQVTGRSDWETLQTFYPELNAVANDGPNSLPLAVTQVIFQPINSTPLEAPVFNLVNESGNRYLASSRARAFLIQQDHIIDLGRPQLDFILALGSTIGDTLCIYDEPNNRQGCQQITAGSERIYLTPIINWTPDIIVTPVTSDTFKVEVSNLTYGLNLTAELFSDDDPPTIEKQLSYSNGAYSTIFIDLPSPVLGGFIYLKDTISGYSAINAFTIGGSPARIYSRAARIRSRAARIRSRAAPLVSGDGQVILYVDDLTFPEEEYYTFQTVSRLPAPLNWATPVGLAYRLTASPNAPVLSGVSISLGYLESDVPDGEESWLQIYFYDGVSWVPLETQVLTSENYAIASSRGRGIYMLMSSYRIELYEPGWSLISYPVNDSRLVGEALLSIEGKYSLVYGFYRLDEVARWQLYAPAAPDWLWDLIEPLSHLVFGRGYWIYATEATTLYIKGTQADQPSPDSFGGYPPAVYFGPVLPAENFIPAAGMIITAKVGGMVCGEGQTLEVDGKVVYAVQVQAEGFSSGSGCGLPGRVITFDINGQAMAQSPEWDNTRLWEIPLRPANKVFLPTIRR